MGGLGVGDVWGFILRDWHCNMEEWVCSRMVRRKVKKRVCGDVGQHKNDSGICSEKV